MAFDKTKMSEMSNHQNSTLPRMYSYTTVDTALVVDTTGYFNNFVGELNVGDLIYAALDTDGTPTYGLAVVLSNDGAIVDISNFTALGAADTD